MTSKIVRYPEIYSRILLTIPMDGTALDLPLPDEASAQKERLSFYNFLKFLRRNPKEAAHFGQRHNLVILRVQGNILSFVLRRASTTQNLEDSFKSIAQAHQLPIAGVPPSSIAPDVSDSIDFTAQEERTATSQINPLDLLNAALGDRK